MLQIDSRRSTTGGLDKSWQGNEATRTLGYHFSPDLRSMVAWWLRDSSFLYAPLNDVWAGQHANSVLSLVVNDRVRHALVRSVSLSHIRFRQR